MTGLEGRPWRCALDPAVLSGIQAGVMRMRYRGRLFLKSPFDVVLYLQLIQRLSPRTIIEIGTHEGGSALWFHEVTRLHGIDGRVVAVDINELPTLSEEQITCVREDARRLGEVLTPAFMRSLERPFLVVEDSAHDPATSLSVLEFFHPFLDSGDYIVVEDGVVQFLPEEIFRSYGNGPNEAVEAFLAMHGESYEIDTTLCDFYGYNVTYNPSGFGRTAPCSLSRRSWCSLPSSFRSSETCASSAPPFWTSIFIPSSRSRPSISGCWWAPA